MSNIAIAMKDFLFFKNEDPFRLIIEDIDTLCSSEKDTNFNTIKSKREKEKLASQKLIKQLYPKTSLSHNSYGAPILSNKKAVSLSHSKRFLACIIAENIAAIDIEPVNEKAFRIRHKFLSTEEIALAKNKDLATLMWCAKECLYKIHQKGELIFTKDMIIHNIEKQHINCSLLGHEYLLYFEKYNKHWVVYYFD